MYLLLMTGLGIALAAILVHIVYRRAQMWADAMIVSFGLPQFLDTTKADAAEIDLDPEPKMPTASIPNSDGGGREALREQPVDIPFSHSRMPGLPALGQDGTRNVATMARPTRRRARSKRWRLRRPK